MIRPTIVAKRIGIEQQPVVVVDGFHPDPDALRAAAAGAQFSAAHHHYPGIRAELPADYVAATRAVIAVVLRDVFGLREGVELIDSSFSIVTTPPGALTVAQRLPHVDAVDRNRIALVHYLSHRDDGGTAFYRHRATGFETIDETRSADYFAALNREIAADGAPPPGYIHASTPHFERIGGVDASYNRAVIYRSAMLHSGAIPPAAPLRSDPASGRLTVTAFLAAR